MHQLLRGLLRFIGYRGQDEDPVARIFSNDFHGNLLEAQVWVCIQQLLDGGRRLEAVLAIEYLRKPGCRHYKQSVTRIIGEDRGGFARLHAR
ncbi:hypothetical protein D3C73_1173650 [compost metagenome]